MGLGHRHSWGATATQPFVSTRGVAVSFDGRLDNREELAPPIPTGGSPSPQLSSDAAYVAALHERTDEAFASHLGGDFAVAVCDPERHRLVLARDLMGARPLYYTQVGQTLVFGSEIKSLLAIRGVTRAPDEDAIADLVLDRWIDPHRTCFRDIFAVPPGHALHANPDRLIVRRHQDFDPCRETRYRSLDDTPKAFVTSSHSRSDDG